MGEGFELDPSAAPVSPVDESAAGMSVGDAMETMAPHAADHGTNHESGEKHEAHDGVVEEAVAAADKVIREAGLKGAIEESGAKISIEDLVDIETRASALSDEIRQRIIEAGGTMRYQQQVARDIHRQQNPRFDEAN